MSGDTPTVLVLLASEQLWPNIHSIEYWAAGLKRVLIYHTPDLHRSAEPARKLAWFCHEQHQLKATPVEGDGTPDAVARQIHKWLEQFPGESWLINATGGTKLMFGGAVSMRGRPRVRLLYRELGPNNLWYELGGAPDDIPTANPITIPHEVTDRIPVQRLLRTLWETETLQLGFAPAPKPLPFPQITQALIESDGNWPAAFAQIGIPLSEKTPSGEPFERYVAAALLEMGVDNLAHSVKQRGSGTQVQTQSTQEIDLVANHGSRLLVFDCKLRTEEEEGREVEGITSQIRQAAHSVRRLGGLGGEVVLLRPNREVAGTTHALARDLRVHIVDKQSRGCFFKQLADFVGCRRLPDSLGRADELLADPANALRAFPTDVGLRRLSAATWDDDRTPVIDLSQLCGNWSREFHQDWSVTRLERGLYHLQYANSRFNRNVLERAIRDLLAPFGDIIQINISNTGNTLFAFFTVADDRTRPFRDFLRSRVGNPLVE